MTAFLVRLGLGGIGLKGLAWLGLASAGLIFAVWLSTKLYMAGVYAERIKGYEATIAQIKADLAANEKITKDAEADARAADAENDRLTDLLETMRNDKSCPLSQEHIDGIRKIDEAK